MVGLIVASPTFAALSKHMQAFQLVGVGLLIWTVAVAACAASWDFWSILVCRMFVGVGEASFVVFAAPFIGAPQSLLRSRFPDCLLAPRAAHCAPRTAASCGTCSTLASELPSLTHGSPADEHAPEAVKSIWIAIFLMAIPVGYALGYIYGGLVGAALGWRLAFLTEALLMAPFVAFAFLTRPIPFGGKHVAALGEGLSPTNSLSPDSVPEHERLLMPEGNVEAVVDALSDGGGASNGVARGERNGSGRLSPAVLPGSMASVWQDTKSILRYAR
jgi:MFS family permease